MSELRDHNKERRQFNPDAWEEHETRVGIFLKEVLKLKVCKKSKTGEGVKKNRGW